MYSLNLLLINSFPFARKRTGTLSANGRDIMKLTLEGVRSPVENDLCCAERPSAPVVVNRGSFQLAELGEELLDVGVGDAEVEVGDDELGGTATASRDPTRPPSATVTAGC